MNRIEELEKELTKVCGIYENDCSMCPKQAAAVLWVAFIQN